MYLAEPISSGIGCAVHASRGFGGGGQFDVRQTGPSRTVGACPQCPCAHLVGKRLNPASGGYDVTTGL
jgi:hypothetical protein